MLFTGWEGWCFQREFIAWAACALTTLIQYNRGREKFADFEMLVSNL
jgi:hypothetical protein